MFHSIDRLLTSFFETRDYLFLLFTGFVETQGYLKIINMSLIFLLCILPNVMAKRFDKAISYNYEVKLEMETPDPLTVFTKENVDKYRPWFVNGILNEFKEITKNKDYVIGKDDGMGTIPLFKFVLNELSQLQLTPSRKLLLDYVPVIDEVYPDNKWIKTLCLTDWLDNTLNFNNICSLFFANYSTFDIFRMRKVYYKFFGPFPNIVSVSFYPYSFDPLTPTLHDSNMPTYQEFRDIGYVLTDSIRDAIETKNQCFKEWFRYFSGGELTYDIVKSAVFSHNVVFALSEKIRVKLMYGLSGIFVNVLPLIIIIGLGLILKPIDFKDTDVLIKLFVLFSGIFNLLRHRSRYAKQKLYNILDAENTPSGAPTVYFGNKLDRTMLNNRKCVSMLRNVMPTMLQIIELLDVSVIGMLTDLITNNYTWYLLTLTFFSKYGKSMLSVLQNLAKLNPNWQIKGITCQEIVDAITPIILFLAKESSTISRYLGVIVNLITFHILCTNFNMLGRISDINTYFVTFALSGYRYPLIFAIETLLLVKYSTPTPVCEHYVHKISYTADWQPKERLIAVDGKQNEWFALFANS